MRVQRQLLWVAAAAGVLAIAPRLFGADRLANAALIVLFILLLLLPWMREES